nr:hypothetical protein [Tanacetum cinerariifolium]
MDKGQQVCSCCVFRACGVCSWDDFSEWVECVASLVCSVDVFSACVHGMSSGGRVLLFSFVKSGVNKASTEKGGHYPPTTCYDYQYPGVNGMYAQAFGSTRIHTSGTKGVKEGGSGASAFGVSNCDIVYVGYAICFQDVTRPKTIIKVVLHIDIFGNSVWICLVEKVQPPMKGYKKREVYGWLDVVVKPSTIAMNFE